jgi:hypothetical protein
LTARGLGSSSHFPHEQSPELMCFALQDAEARDAGGDRAEGSCAVADAQKQTRLKEIEERASRQQQVRRLM